MTQRMRTSKSGFELIKSFEGFRARAKALPDGRWTIGYGHTQSARENLRITRADAEAVLREYDLPPVELAISEAVLAPLNQNEFDALVSFVFNIGQSAFLRSKMLAYLNSGQPLAAVDAMASWRKAHVNGRLLVVDALVRRRVMEQSLFLKHPSGQPVAPSNLFRAVCAVRPIRHVQEQVKPIADIAHKQPQKATTPVPSRSKEVSPPQTDGRLTRELRAFDKAPSPSMLSDAQAGPTPDEITRAISALANPENDTEIEPAIVSDDARVSPAMTPPPFDTEAEEELPKLPGVEYGEDIADADAVLPKPASTKVIDDLEPAEIDPLLLSQAVAKANDEPREKTGRRMFASVLGFVGVVLGGLGVLNLRSDFRAVNLRDTELDIYLSFAAMAFGAFFVLLALFLFFRSRGQN
jgi:lysozyme